MAFFLVWGESSMWCCYQVHRERGARQDTPGARKFRGIFLVRFRRSGAIIKKKGTRAMEEPTLDTVRLKDWLDRVRAGDKAAGEELCRGVANRLEQLARKMLRRHPAVRGYAQTEDVLQNSLVRLWRSLPTVKIQSTG